jgi:hypothetical protein
MPSDPECDICGMPHSEMYAIDVAIMHEELRVFPRYEPEADEPAAVRSEASNAE